MRRPQRGQATVETALLLPFVVLALLAVVQVGIVVHARVMVTHAAREGARVAAVGGSDAEVRKASAVAGGLAVQRLSVSVSRSNGVAEVTVAYADPTDTPIIGAMLGDVRLSAVARMRLE